VYRKAAYQGNAAGQNSLGHCYANGRGVPRDEEEAVKWYRKAADLKDGWSMTELGAMHANGTGLTFADGHAETKRWRKPSSRAPIAGSPHPAPTDRADVMWLRRHAHHLIQ